MRSHALLLVGDNPFHGISHLSQERAIARGKNVANPEFAAGLVDTALANGADGFMFSVSDTTLAILKRACQKNKTDQVKIYALAPYVFELVRMAVTEGGIPGLTKKVGREIVVSRNLGSLLQGFKGIVKVDPASLLKAYLLYVESSIRTAAGKKGLLASIIIHEVITDMALALDMEWLFRTHIELMQHRRIRPGFDTHNFPYLVQKLKQWDIDCRDLTITTQFNAIGFGMSPGREQYENALRSIPEAEVIAYGVLASGYLKLPQAISYLKTLPSVKGWTLGVSKESQAQETFKLIKEQLTVE